MVDIVQTFDEHLFDLKEASMSTMTWDHAAATLRPAAGLRLTARGRIVVGAVGLAIAGAAILGTSSAVAQAPATPVAVQSVTVGTGQTLWQLARTIVRPGEDIRDVVARLVDLNGLDGAALSVGQRILLPVRD